MANTVSTKESETQDEMISAVVAGHEIMFNVSQARRILTRHPRNTTKFRLTVDGSTRLVGARAKGQEAADASVPGIVGMIDDLFVVLEGRARMDAAEGMPRFFPVYALATDETERCVAPASRRVFQKVLKMLRSPAV